jgi:glycosyltransferase involved in cell wall biosynthesis
VTQRKKFPFEIVIQDDASIAEPANILEEYAAKYPKLLRLILQTENQFSNGNRTPQFTFPAVRGKCIALCEKENYWLDADKIAKQAVSLENNSIFSVPQSLCIVKISGSFCVIGKT